MKKQLYIITFFIACLTSSFCWGQYYKLKVHIYGEVNECATREGKYNHNGYYFAIGDDFTFSRDQAKFELLDDEWHVTPPQVHSVDDYKEFIFKYNEQITLNNNKKSYVRDIKWFMNREINRDCDKEMKETNAFHVDQLTFPCYYKHYDTAPLIGGTGNPIHNNFQADISIEPIIKLVDPGTQNAIGYDDSFTLNVTSNSLGFPSQAYHWQYQIADINGIVDDNQWVDMPNSVQNKPSFTIKASDFIFPKIVNRKIYFRINGICNDFATTSIHYDLRNSAPHMTSYTTTKTTCYGSEDGSVTLHFDRAIDPSELLAFSVEDKSNPIGTEPITGLPIYDVVKSYNNSNDYTLSNGNKAVTLGGLPASEGTTFIVRMLAGKGGNMYYTGDSSHRQEFTIDQYPPVSFTSSSTNIFCKGGKDGAITLTASGGIPSENTNAYYEYKLTNNTTTGVWTRFSNTTTHTITELGAGTYELQVRDSNGCIAKDSGGLGNEITKTIILTEPTKAIKLVETYRSEPTGNGLTNGALTFLVTGGTRFTNNTYEFELRKDNPTGNVVNTVTTSFDQITKEYYIQYTNLGAGTYYLTVKDANWASAIDKVDPDNDGIGSCGYINFEWVLDEPEPITGTIIEVQSISCNDDNAYHDGIDANGNGVIDQFEDGILQANITGGVPFTSGNNNLPYQYQWEYQAPNSTTYQAVTQAGSTYLTEQIEALAYGNYRLQVEDANGNQLDDYLYFELQEPEILNVKLTTEAVLCSGGNDGKVFSEVTGGTAPYTYQWSNGATTETISNVTAGTYLVLITDANGCRVNGTVTVEESQELVINTLTEKAPTCYQNNDGEIQVQIIGGTAPYTYEWNTGEKTLMRNTLTQGTYTLTVTDALGCSTQKSYTLVNPEPIQVALGDDITLCTGQELNLDIAIDDSLAVYSWTKDGFDFSNTSQVTLTEAGTYTAKVYSSLGCEGEDTIVISVLNQELEPEYLVSSEAFVGESVILVNVSEPQPQTVKWIVPNGVTVVNEEVGYLEVIFPEEGSYEITLQGTQEACTRDYTKNVVVHVQEALPDIGDAPTPFIEKFVVAPNPNNGNFNAYITLQEESPIVLNVFNMLGHKVVDTVEAQNEKEYTVPYQLVGSGVYIMVLETPKGREIRKIVVL